ncbi:MAG: cytochrome B5 [candidate division Zixibacteria bacterium]|nr:cytochrome B5 [candidate division Zixibacteria bacterium]
MHFTRDELRRYDGKSGRPCYIAYMGMVYDVTDSTMWEEGLHLNEHMGGEDLTSFMENAPHGDDLLEEFPIVGRLVD